MSYTSVVLFGISKTQTCEKRLGDLKLEQTVTIKGTKSGIILVLDPGPSFDCILKSIAEKFGEAATFLGKNNMGLLIRGRKLSDSETKEVVKVIEEISDLTITCIIDEESDYEKVFTDKQRDNEPAVAPITDMDEISLSDIQDNAIVYRGNLRSGQDISSEKSIIILGDVKPGANVTSYGSIFILGELRGNAFAGAMGDKRSVIMALELDPIQIRIAETIAISPDAEKGNKIKIKRKKLLKDTNNGPEVAYIENGHIVKTNYGSTFLRQFYKI